MYTYHFHAMENDRHVDGFFETTSMIKVSDYEEIKNKILKASDRVFVKDFTICSLTLVGER